jgi:hypothetical protein
MKKILLHLLFLLTVSSPVSLHAGPGDTTVVQAFTFGSPQDAWFVFPPDSIRYSRILMYYTLKCNPAQNPACGEWDYLTYNYLYDHTGVLDSNLLSHPSFLADGQAADSLQLIHSQAWNYFPRKEYFNQTAFTDTALIGMGNLYSDLVFPLSASGGRVAFLWKASSLISSGLSAGNITALRLNAFSNPGLLNRFTVKMAPTVMDSIGTAGLVSANFSTLYCMNTDPGAPGWFTLPFAFPFYWDGVSNILVQLSWEDRANPDACFIAADSSSLGSSLISSFDDYYLEFASPDNISIPVTALQLLDTAVTVAFWANGNTAVQPQDAMIFEGFNASGQRVINAHLPWSNGRIYWDCGNTGGNYDRIDKAADSAAMYEGRWNHWAFTKNAATGSMKIYFNGQLWHSGTGKTKTMEPISVFRIGSQGSGQSHFYHGGIDDFVLFKRELSQLEIATIMNLTPGSADPVYSELIACYNFNETNNPVVHDSSAYAFSAVMSGIPQRKEFSPESRFKTFVSSQVLPQIVFEQGIYNPASLDSVFVVDSIAQPLTEVILFPDSLNPLIAADTLYKCRPYYHQYVYDNSGMAVDSSLYAADTVLYRSTWYYYSQPFEIIDRYELGRFITPYGIGLSLGDGFTWVYDLSDYRPLLHDSVHLSAGNWQELLDMKFLLIEGVPNRDVLDVRNVYTGGHAYNADIENNFLVPRKFLIDTSVQHARLKIRNTGHGFGGTLNCAEFCPRTNKVFVNGNLAYTQYLWRDDCDRNPVYHQGGTWIYDRANWCPGAEVWTDDYEISQWMTPGDSIEVNYDMQSGYTWNGQGSQPYYVIESQLVTYGPDNFTLDAAIEGIISPNNFSFYNRYNPVCGRPEIILRNNGTSTLTTLNISYGPQGGNMQNWQWNGSLAYMDTTHVTLPAIDWTGWVNDKRFTVTLSAPNGSNDEYIYNNSMTSRFDLPPGWPQTIILQLKTNNAGAETSWTLEDHAGNIIRQGSGYPANTVINDTINLADGCYKFSLYDSGEDGLSFFANNDGNGYCRFKSAGGTILKTFQPDFGSFTFQSFFVGQVLSIGEESGAQGIRLMPNPVKDFLTVELNAAADKELVLELISLTGSCFYSEVIAAASGSIHHVDVSALPAGIWICRISGQGVLFNQRLVIMH